jgi:hypothetical protein
MIQRIQSVYLLIAAILLALLFFFPLADLIDKNGVIYTYLYRGLYGPVEGNQKLLFYTTPLAILYLLILMMNFSNIFLYKFRSLQMKICLLNIFLILASLAVFYYYLASPFSNYAATVNYKIFALSPIIAAIFIFLAYKSIHKDEKLVKSIDRIR